MEKTHADSKRKGKDGKQYIRADKKDPWQGDGIDGGMFAVIHNAGLSGVYAMLVVIDAKTRIWGAVVNQVVDAQH